MRTIKIYFKRAPFYNALIWTLKGVRAPNFTGSHGVPAFKFDDSIGRLLC
jgi:hypothetical protein